MKFITRQYLSVVFIFMMLLESSIAFNKKYTSFKRNTKYLNKFYSTKKQLNRITTLNIKNPYFSFIVGFFESFGIQDINYIECLPEEWSKDIEVDNKKISSSSEVFISSYSNNGFFGTFLSYFAKYWENFCTLRDYLIDLLKAIFATEGQKPLESFLEGKFIRNRGKFWEWIKSVASQLYDGISKTVQSALEKIEEALKNLLIDYFTNLLDVKGFITRLVGHDLVDNVLRIIDCLTHKPKLIVDNIKKIIQSGYNKIKNVISVIKSGITTNIILVIADLVVGILCNYEELKVSIDYFNLAYSNNEPVNKWFFYGRGLGSLISSIANARTIYDSIKNQNSDSSSNILQIKTIYKSTINNPFANFVIGVGDIMGKDETIWLDCLPCEWTESTDYSNDALSPVEANISKLNPELQKYLNYIGAIWPLVCKAREPLVKIFTYFLSNENTKENSFLEVKLRKKFISRKGFIDTIKKGINFGFDKLEDNLKFFVEKNPNLFRGFVDYIYNWFSDSLFQKIKRILNCIFRIANYSLNIWKTFSIGIKKIQLLITNRYNFAYWADFLVAVLCNWAELKKSIDFFLYAKSLKDINEKWYFYGRSVGSLITAISYSKPLIKPDIKKEKESFIKKMNLLIINPKMYHAIYGYPSKSQIDSYKKNHLHMDINKGGKF